ncbi:hypothetical protein BDV95DRAFT_112981 [Massariosphaeria phaeospora]|uniref:FAD-binding domain-containing protein n=1 Tax=Massariosphaeria phaeospora TaxID=100035 RepID=A0A7C8I664_9PLEO|nr:hypothetical protein BDV95DRAFT_112981 [Massariosphaeria phaeospora]
MAKTAVIVGGSLAGLMHGIMLKQQGYDVTILEQEASTTRLGFDAGIRVGPAVVNFMNQYDRTGRPYEIAATTQFIDKKGAIKLRTSKTMSFTCWSLLLSILRENFDGAPPSVELSEEEKTTKRARYQIGVRVSDLKDAEETVQVHTEDVLTGTTDSISADLVVAADGSNSSIRSILMPDVRRQYAGYVAWRGTVPESRVPEQYRQVFEGHVTLHFMERNYILVYVIPTDDGHLQPGSRLYNFVWYTNMAAGSKDLAHIMTDTAGKTHYGTVPRGLVQPHIWEAQRATALAHMPPCIASLIKQTQAPFVTKIHDAVSPHASFFHGKLFLVGDALVTLRPHIALSTNQAAYDCELLGRVLEGGMAAEQWEERVLRYANRTRMYSVVIGVFGTGSRVELIREVWRTAGLLVRQALGFVS